MDHGDNLIELILDFSLLLLKWISIDKVLGFTKIILDVQRWIRNKKKTFRHETMLHVAIVVFSFNLPQNLENMQSHGLYFFLDLLDRL